MVIDISGTTVESITHSLVLGGGEQNLGGNVVNNEEIPIMRHANARNGRFIVEVNDGGTYSKTLAELLALHSSAGKGTNDITIDDEAYSYNSLITVSMIGKLGQLVLISFEGSTG